MQRHPMPIDSDSLQWTIDVGFKISKEENLASGPGLITWFSIPFHTLIKLCYTKAPEWSSLVPGPKAKFSSLEIMNLTSFTIRYHMDSRDRLSVFQSLFTSYQLCDLRQLTFFVSELLPMKSEANKEYPFHQVIWRRK